MQQCVHQSSPQRPTTKVRTKSPKRKKYRPNAKAYQSWGPPCRVRNLVSCGYSQQSSHIIGIDILLLHFNVKIRRSQIRQDMTFRNIPSFVFVYIYISPHSYKYILLKYVFEWIHILRQSMMPPPPLLNPRDRLNLNAVAPLFSCFVGEWYSYYLMFTEVIYVLRDKIEPYGTASPCHDLDKL